MANGHPMEADTFFHVHWNCGKIILQSPNGRFLGIVDNGLLMANATIPGEESGPPARLFQVREAFRGSCDIIEKALQLGSEDLGLCIC